MGRRRGGSHTRYALYKGEELLCIGTAAELAIRLGVELKTIYFYASEANKRRDNGNRLVAERI